VGPIHFDFATLWLRQILKQAFCWTPMIQEWILPDIEKSNAVTEDENDNGGMTDGKKSHKV